MTDVALAGRFFFFSSRRRHTRCSRDWSSDVCSSDLRVAGEPLEHLLGWVEFYGLRIEVDPGVFVPRRRTEDRKSTRLNSSHGYISYAVFCLKKKKKKKKKKQKKK